MKPRQLHDLRILPAADDPRPTFFWSAAPPRDGRDLTRTTLYPRLMWHGQTGQEVTASSPTAQQTYTAQGYVLVPPANAETLNPVELLRVQLAQLSPEDQALLMDGQKKARMASLAEKLAALSSDELASLEDAITAPAPKKKGVA